MLNTKKKRQIQLVARDEFYLSYEFFSYDRHDKYDDMETRLKERARRGDSYMEQTGMLVGNFEFNP